MKGITFVKILLVLLFSCKECCACFNRNQTITLGIMKSGTPFYRECECETPSSSSRSLRWFDAHDQEIRPKGPGTQPNVYTEWSRGSLNLMISNLSKTLAGKYKCVTEHRDGRRYAYIYDVPVYDPLYFISTEETQYLIEGRDSLIHCEARGEEGLLINWHKGSLENWDPNDQIEIIENEKYELRAKGLLIKNASYDDEATYKCTASVIWTGEDVDRYIKVKVLTPPQIDDIEATPNKTVIAGEALTLECNAEGSPPLSYAWITVPKMMTPTKQVNWRQEDNKLVFDSIKPDDRGVYQCIVQNDADMATKQLNVEVFTPPVITEFNNITAAEGSIAQIVCKASGRPRPALSIIFEGESSDNDASITWSELKTGATESEFHLIFNKVVRSNAGFYYCNASNTADVIIESMYMGVMYKPHFNEEMEVLWAWEDNPIDLNCEHDSEPPAQVEWSFHGGSNEIPLSDQNEVQRLLSLNSRESSDLKSNHVLHLKIFSKAQYGTYECTVKNDFGQSVKRFIVKEGLKPGFIKKIKIKEEKASSAIFFIEGPDYAGPPVIGFTAEYDEAFNYDITNIHINRTWAIDKEYKLDKLKPNTTYYIKFAAVNNVGAGPFSKMIAFQTPAKSKPEPPVFDYESNSTETLTDRNRVLRLKPPEDSGDPIDHYYVKYCPAESVGGDLKEDLCKEYNTEPSTELQLENLDHNTTYYVKLVAYNSMGYSEPTEIYFRVPEVSGALTINEESLLSSEAIIGISVVVVILSIILLDVLLFVTVRKGAIASCCFKKSKKKKESSVLSRDKKGLLKDNGESVEDPLKRPDNGHKEFEYNKTTGVITGKHSAV